MVVEVARSAFLASGLKHLRLRHVITAHLDAGRHVIPELTCTRDQKMEEFHGHINARAGGREADFRIMLCLQ